MAQFFGGRSRYIIIMERVSHFAMVAMWFFLAWLAYRYIGRIFQYKSAPIASVITLTILLLPAFYWVFREERRYKKERDAYRQGGKGEGAIYYELLKLPDSYFVFQDIKLPEREDNIDFAVIGQAGIFTVEVKSHEGIIGFNGEELLRNGKVIIEKDFIKQTMGEAISLQAYLKQNIGKDFFVNPVLVFSRADVRFGFKLIKNIYIIGRAYLNKLILTGNKYLSEDDILILKNELSKVVKK